MKISQNLLIAVPFKSFLSRLINSMRWPTAFIILLTVVMYAASSSIVALAIGLIFFLFYLIENRLWCRFYITEIRKTETQEVKIIFFDKDIKKEYASNTKLMRVEKKYVWYKLHGREPYVVIHNATDQLKIKQHCTGDWTEKELDRVVNLWHG